LARTHRKGAYSSGHRTRACLAVGLAATLAVALLTAANPFGIAQRLELQSLDVRFRLRPPIEQSSLITHIDIDDASIEQLGRWTWPRTVHAQLLHALSELGATSVVFDVEFPESSARQAEAELLIAGVQEPLAETFSTLEAWAKSVDDQLAALGEGSVDVSEMRRVFAELSRFSRDGAEMLGTAMGKVLSDPDQALALAMTRVPVYLPFSFQQKFDLGHVVDKAAMVSDVEAQLDRLLSRDFLATAKEASAEAGPRVRRIEDWWSAYKERWAIEQAALFLENHPGAPLGQYVAWAAPEASRAEGSAELAMLARAFDRARAVDVILQRAPVGRKEQNTDGVEGGPILPPISALAERARNFGFVNIDKDSDGVLRQCRLLRTVDGRTVAHLGLRAALDVPGMGSAEVSTAQGVIVLSPGLSQAQESPSRPILIPTDEKGRVILNWPGAPGRFYATFAHIPYAVVVELLRTEEEVEANFDYVDQTYGSGRLAAMKAELAETDASSDEYQSLAVLIEDEKARLLAALTRLADKYGAQVESTNDEAQKAALQDQVTKLRTDQRVVAERIARAQELREFLEPRVKDKVCIVGTTFTGGTDFWSTPVQGDFPGAGVTSTIVNMVMQKAFLSRIPTWVNLVLMLAAGLAGSLAASQMNALRSGPAAVALLVAYALIAYGLFAYASTWIDFVGPSSALLLSWATVVGYREITEEKQKRFIRKAFQYYISPDVVELIVRDAGRLELGGERRVVTVMFADIRGFTGIAETMEADELVKFLNDYHEEMTQVILSEGGCLDKYEGDGLLAFFGAPLEASDHAARACRAALRCQECLEQMRESFRQAGRPEIHSRFGINTGEVLVGNMGSRERFDYTVIGDAVNLTRRLETANKELGTSIIIGEATYEGARDEVEARDLGYLNVAGKKGRARAYELRARRGESSEEEGEALKGFAEGLAYFRMRRWDESIACFRKVLEAAGDDGPSRAYIQACEAYKQNPPDADWQETFVIESK